MPVVPLRYSASSAVMPLAFDFLTYELPELRQLYSQGLNSTFQFVDLPITLFTVASGAEKRRVLLTEGLVLVLRDTRTVAVEPLLAPTSTV